jgi:hypothetical protein
VLPPPLVLPAVQSKQENFSKQQQKQYLSRHSQKIKIAKLIIQITFDIENA